jgi:5'-3' exonuclease
MGIKGLFTFLKRWEQPVDTKEAIKNKSVGLDIFWFIHQSKGDIAGLQAAISVFLQYALTVHAVFDGHFATQERREELEERRDKRYRAIEIMEEIMEAPIMEKRDQKVLERHMTQLKRQIWKPSRSYIDQIKCWLIENNAIIHEPIGEADQTLIMMENMEIINLIVTNDSDLISLGAETVLRVETLRRIETPRSMVLRVETPRSMVLRNGTILSKTHMRKQMGFTKECWKDFMYLCQKMEPLIAYSMIRVYKEHAVERYLA